MKQEDTFIIDEETLKECINDSIDTAEQNAQPMIVSSR
jgi:hypothetical protein